MVSEIQGTSSSIVQSADNRKNQVENRKVDEANKVASTPSASSSVNLTQTATSLQALEKSVKAAPEVDQQKVDVVRKSINEGSFKIDAERTASKLIDFDTALPKST